MKQINKNILTIDCEDFLSLPAFKEVKTNIDWDELIEKQVNLVLDTLLAAGNTKATFFIVGEIAKRNPELISKIEKHGHHIGSHGYYHIPIHNLSQKEFETDLKESLRYLNDAIDSQVNCYRAPIWSYKNEMNWFWKVLKENKILYDSSIFPFKNTFYGDSNAKRIIHEKECGIFEIPPSTFRFFGFNFPFSGGIYFRFLPYFLIRFIIKWLRKRNQPVVMYFHPWELDPEPIIIDGISKFYKFILYHNSKRALKKYTRLINDFEFTSIQQFNNI